MARPGVTVKVRSHTVAIVQARMGSSRFPGKMLACLGGIPILEWVLRRLSRSSTIDQIVLATSTEKSDDVLCDLTTGLGVTVFRGSETDVLGRFIGAATLTDATNVVRVCADNPFIDPIEIDRLVNFFFDNPCDYACNHQDRLGSGYADGFGAEICSVLTLKKINDAANDMRYREHATLYIWENSSEFKIKVIEAPLGLRHPKLRFDIDTPEDLIRMKQYVNGGVTTNTTASEIIRFSLTIS